MKYLGDNGRKMCDLCGRFPAIHSDVRDGKEVLIGGCCALYNGSRVFALEAETVEGESVTLVNNGYDFMGANFGFQKAINELELVWPEDCVIEEVTDVFKDPERSEGY